MRNLIAIVLLLASGACGDDDAGSGAADTSLWQTHHAPDATQSTSWSDSAGQNTAQPTHAADTGNTWAPNDSGGGAEVSAPVDDGNTNIALGGAQDFGFPRKLISEGTVPRPEQLEAAGFFAEHSTPLPQPVCGNRICVQAMLGVMGNLVSGQACTMLQLGLNSPIVVDPGDRPPLTLAIVVDTSGSMSDDDRIGYVRDGLRKLVSALYDDDRIAIITFETTVHVLVGMTEIRGNRNMLIDLVDDLVASGSTNIHDGLREGYQTVMAEWESGRQNRVILLSDGQATAGIVDDASILAMSRAFNSDGVGLTTVGLGSSFNLALMQGLAEQADGNFYFLENATAVDEVFTEEIGYFTLPVAFDVTLDVRATGDYTILRASGSDKFVLDATGGRLEAPSVFFAHRVAHDDVHEGEDGVGRRGGGSALVLELMPNDLGPGTVYGETGHVADVSLRYREPGTNVMVDEVVEVVYPHAPNEVLGGGFFENGIVTKTFVMLNIYVAIESACERFHAGHPVDAINVLLRVIAGASDYEDSANAGEGDVDIALDIELMEDLIAVIEEASGINDPPPPAIPEDPWPAD